MKQQLTLPLSALALGAAAFVLRLLQMRTGFEPDTGLPIPGAPAGLALTALLALGLLALVLLARRLPADEGDGPAFPFVSSDARLLMLPVAGIFLMALSGVLDLLSGLGLLEGVLSAAVTAADPTGMTTVVVVSSAVGFSRGGHLVMGLLSLASAAGLFAAAISCRPGRKAVSGTVLLVPVVALVIRLVLTYRVDSVEPSLSAYYVELLALIFLTLGFYRLSSFAFQTGRTRRFALYASAAAVLSLATAADGGSGPSSVLLYVGGGAVLMGFLLLRLSSSTDETP